MAFPIALVIAAAQAAKTGYDQRAANATAHGYGTLSRFNALTAQANNWRNHPLAWREERLAGFRSQTKDCKVTRDPISCNQQWGILESLVAEGRCGGTPTPWLLPGAEGYVQCSSAPVGAAPVAPAASAASAVQVPSSSGLAAVPPELQQLVLLLLLLLQIARARGLA